MYEGIALEIGVKFKTIKCYSCSGFFAIDEDTKSNWKTYGTSFYCPHCGQSQHYSNTKVSELENKIKKLESNNTSLENDREYWFGEYESEKNSKKAYKGHFTRLKKKVKNGDCPCCNEHFDNLQRHMDSEHPEYLEELATNSL